MARGREIMLWDVASVMWATMVNLQRGKGQIPVKPHEVHPYRHRLDYQTEPHDADYHRQRRLLLLPEDQRREAVAKIMGIDHEQET